MTKKLILIYLVFFFIISCKKSVNEKSISESITNKTDFWTDENAIVHYQNRNDSLKWDKEMFLNDLKHVENEFKNPITSGVFPEPAYNLIGEDSFKGVGTFGNTLEFNNKNILYRSFYVKKSNLNKGRLLDKKNEVFFNIVVLTDTIDLKNYNLSSSLILSRNHPNYISQGMFKTKQSKVDYLAFTTIDNNSYAIVNMRLFDLKFGKTILIAPQVDKSFRSLQAEMPMIEFEELESYMDDLMKEKNVIDFFVKKGNI